MSDCVSVSVDENMDRVYVRDAGQTIAKQCVCSTYTPT